jgi:pantoate--beta-alanine ligase
MIVVRTIAALRRELDRRAGRPRAFVPTMGALHAGHTALFEAARRASDLLVASSFVNPMQFDDPNDLATYPRPEADDAQLARASGVDVLFVPGDAEIYPPADATRVEVGGPALGFEGASRPGHFAGVATVCLKLFNIVVPDAAYFGQKDAQQVAVIRRLVADLHLPLEIRVVPTVRDADGLALSSRNVRLSAEERRRALALPRALRMAIAAHAAGHDPLAAALRELGEVDVEYLEIAPFDGDPTLVAAVRLGKTRLIDNVPLGDPARAGLEGQ